MDYSISWRGSVLIGKLKGEVGYQEQVAMTNALEEMTKSAPSGIVLDFRDVVYLASMGIGMLMKLAKDFRARGISVRLAAPRPGVRMLLDMVRADTVIPIDDSIDEAVARLPVAV